MGEKRIGGILRRDPVPFQYRETPDNELLVFGYQCKLYRDDVKALSIDQGRHLIPCPSNATLKVDRYDVRSALHDLTLYEPPPGGFHDRFEGLTLAERKAEELCEEERYYDLFHNDVDEELYQEDSNSGFNGAKIGFNYDPDQSGPPKQDDEGTQDGMDIEPFVAPSGFYIPPEMDVPETQKQQAVIEKTAKFISSQGLQMEILLKAKQSNNPLFSFLIHDDKLFPYYKHMLDAMKNNVYPVIVEQEKEKVKEEKPTNDMEQHRSIVDMDSIMSYEERPSKVPVPNYTPSQDCVYFQLMKSLGKMAGTTIPSPPVVASNAEPHLNGQGNSVQKQITIPSGLQGLVAYNSDSEDSEEETPEEKEEQEEAKYDGPLPTDHILHFIHTTVNYVVKCGDKFEDSLREKNDPKFDFLIAGNEFYPYYMFKLGKVAPQIVKARQAAAAVNAKLKNAKKLNIKNNPPAPVSFSIKSKDDNSSAVISNKQVLSQESGEDGESPTTVVPAAPAISTNNVSSTTTRPELEEKLKEVRRAEEQIRNKLAAAAREKLGNLSKEEQLRQERKLKAKSFLAKLQQSSSTTATESLASTKIDVQPPPAPTIFPVPPSIGPVQCESDVESIHSIPESTSDRESNEVEEPIEVLSSGTESSRHTPSPVLSNSKKLKLKKHKKKEKKEKKSKKSSKRSRRHSRDESRDSSVSSDRSRSKSKSKKRRRSRSVDRRYTRRS